MIRDVVWLGDSRKNLKKFPDDVQNTMGFSLMTVQYGETPDTVKPFKYVGSGVFEIAESYKGDAYRMVYGVQIGKKIYVLHAFQKKAKSGIATPKKDVELIKSRYREAQEAAKNES